VAEDVNNEDSFRRLEAVMARNLTRLTLSAVLAGTAALAAIGPTGDLTVHEWGTFTSMAAPDGTAVEWTPLSKPSDLPCFVTLLNPKSLKIPTVGALAGLKATVRMETPVLYFYSSHALSVRATVKFPQGLVTEWYPGATVPPASASTPLANTTGGIEWNDVRIRPGTAPHFPMENGGSHYYAARETDATPLEVGGASEKFLFYRGLASFPIPVSVASNRDGTFHVMSTGNHDIRTLILFESDGSRVRYQVTRGASKDVTLSHPTVAGSLDSLRRELQTILIEEGLYPKEARAMVDTWRDAWFEKGTRLFYLLPQASVDAILPLRIEPVPTQVMRVFVGRIELNQPNAPTVTRTNSPERPTEPTCRARG
jgi:hypothetical protein